MAQVAQRQEMIGQFSPEYVQVLAYGAGMMNYLR